MTQQTAVEWLIEYCDRENWSIPNNIIAKAKEMEKEQIVNAWIATDNELQRISAEKYYNETFEGKGIAEENWQTFESYWDETFKSE